MILCNFMCSYIDIELCVKVKRLRSRVPTPVNRDSSFLGSVFNEEGAPEEKEII